MKDKKVESSSGKQKLIDAANKTHQSHTIEHAATKIIP